MSFSLYEEALSKPRIGRYYNTILLLNPKVANAEELAIELYELNLVLAGAFYPILNTFEVILRNNVNNFLSNHFKSVEWIVEQCNEDGYFSLSIFEESAFKVRKEILEIHQKMLAGGIYTHDKLVAKLSFGFWVHKFSSKEFRETNQSIHKSFINRPKDTKHKTLFADLHKILEFRNRIAHYEPILFDKVQIISTKKATDIFELVKKLSSWINPAFTTLMDSHELSLNKSTKDVNNFVDRLCDLQVP